MFEGGFLGLDNIGVFDRSAPLPDRRPPRAGRRHGVDGALLPEHARDRDRARRRRSELRGHGIEVRRALLLDRVGDEPHRARDGMWDEEDGFFYDVLRLARRQRAAAQGALDGRPAAALRDDRRSSRGSASACPQVADACGERLAAHARAAAERRTRPARTPRRRRPRHPRARQRGAAAAHPGAHARREGVPEPVRHPLALALPPRASVRLHASTAQEYRGRLPAGGVRHRHVRRQLELARPDLDAGQRADHPRAAAVLPLLRRRLQGRVPDRLGPADEPVRGERGDRRAVSRASSCATRTAAGRSSAAPRSSRPTRTGATTSCSTSTSTATTAPASAPATRPAGRASSRA